MMSTKLFALCSCANPHFMSWQWSAQWLEDCICKLSCCLYGTINKKTWTNCPCGMFSTLCVSAIVYTLWSMNALLLFLLLLLLASNSYYWVSLCCLSVPFSIIQSDSFLTFVIYTPHVCVFSRILNDLGPPSWSICQGTSKVVSSIKWNGFILIMLTTAWASFWRVHTA